MGRVKHTHSPPFGVQGKNNKMQKAPILKKGKKTLKTHNSPQRGRSIWEQTPEAV